MPGPFPASNPSPAALQHAATLRCPARTETEHLAAFDALGPEVALRLPDVVPLVLNRVAERLRTTAAGGARRRRPRRTAPEVAQVVAALVAHPSATPELWRALAGTWAHDALTRAHLALHPRARHDPGVRRHLERWPDPVVLRHLLLDVAVHDPAWSRDFTRLAALCADTAVAALLDTSGARPPLSPALLAGLMVRRPDESATACRSRVTQLVQWLGAGAAPARRLADGGTSDGGLPDDRRDGL